MSITMLVLSSRQKRERILDETMLLWLNNIDILLMFGKIISGHMNAYDGDSKALSLAILSFLIILKYGIRKTLRKHLGF